MNKPAILPVQPEHIPAELRALDRWALWTLTWNADKACWTKPPFQTADPSRHASSTNRETWAPFPETLATYEDGKGDGIGFMLNGDRILAGDLDHCFDAHGTLNAEAAAILADVRTYAERSVLGSGVHFCGRGALPVKGKRRNGYEIYATERFLTFSGHLLPGVPTTINDSQEAALRFYRDYCGGNGVGPEPPRPESSTSAWDDDDLLARARGAKNGARFSALWAGDTSLHDGDDSRADQALRMMLAFWTGRDAARMDRLFRQSGLMRGKWDETRGPSTYGADTVRKAILQCREVYSPRTTSHEASSTSGPSERAETATPSAPTLDAGDLDLARASAAAWRALQAANDPPEVFRYGGLLARLDQDDDGTPIPTILTEARLRHRLARCAQFVTKHHTQDSTLTRPAMPPLSVVRDLLAAPELPVPILRAVVQAPTFTATGQLHAQPGYHPESGLVYAPHPSLRVPDVSANPTAAEIVRAVSLIDELIADFPFVGNAERAHAFALLVLPFVRELISGPTPIHLIEKPAPGTGGTLLASSLAHPALGRDLAAMTEGRDEDEWRKRLTARLRRGGPYVLIDNVTRRLDSPALAMAITSHVYEDRLLGSSDEIRLPVRCGWIVTGNNPGLSGELARRTIRIRLDARVDRPWLRDGFRHPDLPAWTQDHRGDLIWAALTLGQAWLVAGRPGCAARLGMFEHWAQVLGGILTVANVPGFLSNLIEFYDASDRDGQAWRAFVAGWWDHYADRAVGVSDLWQVVNPTDGELIDLGLEDAKSERGQKSKLGRRLADARDRIFGDFQIVSAGEAKGGTQRWRLRPVGAASEDGG